MILLLMILFYDDFMRMSLFINLKMQIYRFDLINSLELFSFAKKKILFIINIINKKILLLIIIN